MAVAYVNAGTLTGNNGSTSATPPLPASIVAGNLLIAAVFVNNSGAVTWPSGWTEINQQSPGAAYRASIAYRVATGTDTAPTVTWASNAGNVSQVAQFSGTSAAPIGALSSQSGTTSPHTSAAITTTGDNSYVLLVDLSRGTTLLTNPAGWTQNANAADSLSWCSFYFGGKTVATAGSSSGAVSTAGGTPGWAQWQQELLVTTPTSSATLQNITASGAGYSGIVSGATLQNITASAGSAITGSAGTSATTLQNITASGTAGFSIPGSMVKTSQYKTKSMTGFWWTPKVGQMPIKSMTGTTGTVAVMVRTGQIPIKSMVTWPTGTMVKTAQLGVKSMIGLVGTVGTMVKTAQYGQTAKTGYFNITATMSRTGQLPIKSMVAQVGTGGNWIVVSMHAERQALTQYTNYQFNSFGIFNGRVLAAGDAGLFELTGATDNGTPIAATISGGVTDFGTSYRKNIDYTFVGYRTDGDLLFSLISSDDGKQYDYPLLAHSVTAGMYGRRVLVGKGLRARYFQWKITNQNGADFKLDSVEIDAKQLVRHIGGADA